MRRERYVRFGAGTIAFAIVALIWHFGQKQSGGIAPAALRRAMPGVAMEQLGGGTWKMEGHRGEVVLVNYWATWCGPCRDEMPGLVKLEKDLGPQGFAVVGVSLDEGDRKKVKEFTEKYRVNYPIAFPAPLSQVEMAMEGVPSTILVDRQGRVAKTYVGAVNESDFRVDAEELLAEK